MKALRQALFAGFTAATIAGWAIPAAAHDDDPSEDAAPQAEAPALAPLTVTPLRVSAQRGTEAPPAATLPGGTRILFGGSAGYAMGYLSHPDLVRHGFGGPMLELDVGVAVHPAWTFAFEFTTVEVEVRRGADGFAPVGHGLNQSSLHILAGSTRPSTSTNGQGGLLVALPVHLHTIGPRVEFTPSGSDGLYLGLTAGAAVVQDLPTRLGGAVAGRAGYRFRPIDALGFSIEAGCHGQLYKDASAAFPFAAVQMRLFLLGLGAQ